LWSRVAFAAFPLIALALVVLPRTITEPLRLWAHPILSPLQNLAPDGTLNMGGEGRTAGFSAEIPEGDLRDEVVALTATLDQADRQVKELSQIRKELAGLPCRLTPANFIPPEMPGGQAVGRLSGGTAKGIRKTGVVISRRLNRGTREAIEHGNPVILVAGLVGVVDDVGPMTSTVRLITDPRLSIMVQVITCRGGQWRAGPEGVAHGGDDGQTVTVQGVPRASDIEIGDYVVTSPAPESTVPPYLIVGRVKDCDLKAAALFRTLTVQPRVPLADVREVYVLSPEGAGDKR
jgi:hypothetical protein